MRRTKILATLGPSVSGEPQIHRLIEAGANALRINFSHGTDAEHGAALATVRQVCRRSRREIAIVADLQGPKIRLGPLRGNTVRLVDGETWALAEGTREGDRAAAFISFPRLLSSVRIGDPIILGDGAVELSVDRVLRSGIQARVVHGGIVSGHAGVYLPRAKLRSSILSAKDRADLRRAVGGGADYVALSFVRDASDVSVARRLLKALRRGSEVGVIAKIERAEALQAIGPILIEADGVMVARGDLGIEVPLERLAVEQKRIVGLANAAHKPVIVATQMLLSMVNSPRPTRAEATDVANAVLDGADAVMLSEESAVGKFPFESVQWLDRICVATELAIASGELSAPDHVGPDRSDEAAVARAAVQVARDVRAAAIVAPTHSGRTARLIASLRPAQPVVALSSQSSTLRHLALTWGVEGRAAPAHLPLERLRAAAEGVAVEAVGARPNDAVVLTAGYPIEGRPTNLVTVLTVGVGRGGRTPGSRAPGRPASAGRRGAKGAGRG